MKSLLILCLFFSGIIANAQINFDAYAKHTMLSKLKDGDSIIYYQCRAKTAEVTVKTESQTITSKQQSISISEKFTILKINSSYFVKYFVSSINVFPNRKFSGLKIREKAYWEFNKKAERELSENEVIFLAALEKKAKETTEYDFAITKYTTNQLIIKRGKEYEQLLPKETLSISEALKF